MNSKNNASSDKEAEYTDLTEVLNGYLTSERLIDDLLEHPYFQRKSKARCGAITRNVDKGWDLFQDACEHVMERDCEGPVMSSTKSHPASLRSADIHTVSELLAWFRASALNLARSEWRKSDRRNGKVPIHHDPVEEHHVASNGADLEDQWLLGEFCKQISTLPDEKRFAVECYLFLGYSEEMIAKMLTSEGVRCSRVTVGSWIAKALRKFRGDGKAASLKKAS